MEIDELPGKSISRDHLLGLRFNEERQTLVSTNIISLSIVLIVAPTVHLLIRRKWTSIGISAQLLAGFMGVAAVLISHFTRLFTLHNASIFETPYNLLIIYHTILIARFVFPMDPYIIRKSIWYILIVCIASWVTFIISFGFLLLVFAGELGSLTFPKVCLIGAIFMPNEMPSILLNKNEIQFIQVIMGCETMVTISISMVALSLLIGDMSGLFVNWYQPLMVLFRLIFLAIILGFGFGSLCSMLIQNRRNSIYIVLLIICTNYLLYHVAQFVVNCNGGLCCFVFMLMLNKKRPMISQEVNDEIIDILDLIYFMLSTMISFIIMCDTLPLFLELFTFLSIATSVALYILANACRGVFYVCIAPLLSRLARSYSLNFKSFITMSWCIKKGPLPFILLSLIFMEDFSEVVPKKTLLLGFSYMLLTNIVNEPSSYTLLFKMRLIEVLSRERSVKLINAVKIIEQKRANHLNNLRMQTKYTDANWEFVQKITKLPIELDSNKTEHAKMDKFKFNRVPPYCYNCKQEVQYEPSQREYQDMLKEIHLKILNRLRASYSCQYHNGFVDLPTFHALDHLLDEAFRVNDYAIKVEKLLDLLSMKPANRFYQLLRKLRFKHDAGKILSAYSPRYSGCYTIMSHWSFHLLIDIITIVQCSILIARYISPFHVFNVDHMIAFVFYLFEFVITFLGCYSVKKKDGFQRFIRDNWNKFFFVLNAIGLFDIAIYLLVEGMLANLHTLHNTTFFEYLIKFLSVIRFLRLLRIARLLYWLPKCLRLIILVHDQNEDDKLTRAYSICMAFVVSYEQVDEILHTLSEEQKVIKNVRTHLQGDRNKVIKQLGLIDLARPIIPMIMKTRQGMMTTLSAMHHAVKSFCKDGLIDSTEYACVQENLKKMWHVIMKKRLVLKDSPQNLLREVSWVGNEEQVFKFLCDNSRIKVWEAGELICSQGDAADAIFIVISGMCKEIYNPTKAIFDDLSNKGQLPIKDKIRHDLFMFCTEEYIASSQSFGELSVMTGRPLCCNIWAELPTEAFIISKELILKATKLSPDPINGLFSRIWTHISCNLVRSILKKTKMYQSLKTSRWNELMERSFMPRLDAYNMFCTNMQIEAMVLVEGCAMDKKTGDVYVAPCFIPRGSTYLNLSNDVTKNSFGSKPKIWIVPYKDMDQYQVMMNSEIASELDESAMSECFLLKHSGSSHWKKQNKPSLIKAFMSMSSTKRDEFVMPRVHTDPYDLPSRLGFNNVSKVSDMDAREEKHT